MIESALIFAAALLAQPATQIVELAEKQDAAIVVLTPFGGSERARPSVLVSAAAAAFDAKTTLRLLPAQIDVDAMLACPEDRRLTCWVALAGEARYALLFIVTVVPSESEDRVAMTLIDLAEARGLSEEQIIERIADVPPKSAKDTEAMFATAIENELSAFLDKRGHFALGAAIDAELECSGCSVQLDDKSIAVTAPRIELRGVKPGRHVIWAVRGSEQRCRAELELSSTERAKWSCSISELTEPTPPLVYAGLGTAAVGIASIAVSHAILSGGPRQVCVARDESGCDFVTSAHTGFGATGVQPIGEVNGGFPLLPAGAGLVAAGASWTIGSLVLDEDRWWVTLIAGVAAGATTSAIAFVLE